MEDRIYQVLLIEDNQADARLIREFLRLTDGAPFALTHVDRLGAGLQHLQTDPPDVILLDLSLPDSHGWETFDRLHNQATAVPIVILTGLQDEVLARKAASSGAQDYLVKGEINGFLLVRTLNYAIERQQLLQRQQKLNRALTVLSDVNQAVVRARDEQALLDEVCAVLAGKGGYRLVWVGFAETDGQNRILPMAWAGSETAYLNKINVEVNGSVSGRGPTGTAIRTGRPFTVRDIQNDPVFAPWRKDAGAHGIRAMIALPLLKDGTAFGALDIYTAETGAFDEAEVALLTELAGDLAYGIDNLRTNDALRQSEEMFATAFHNSTVGMMIASVRSNQIIDVNDSTLKLFGYERSEVIDSAAEKLNLWTDPEMQQKIGELLSHGHSVRDLELEGRTKGGDKRHVLVSFDQIELNNEPCILTIMHDITERKRAAEERITQAQRMQQVLDTMPEGVVLLDSDQRILNMNPTAEKLLPALTTTQLSERLTEVGGRPIADFLTATRTEAAWHEVEALDGNRLFALTAQPIKLDETVSGWALVLREVTEERKRQQHLQMQDRLATVGQLAAGIAHDFNNIMAVISLYSDLLIRNPGNERRTIHLQTINEQAKHAAKLIGQILDFSRRSVMTRSKLDLRPFVKELVKLLQRTLPETIEVAFTEPAGQYLVEADPTHLQQALMNLAVNARDAMPDGGTLQIALTQLSLSAGERMPVPEMAPGGWLCLSVTDTGSGIAADIMPHLFEPFFTTKNPGQGTGLGLAQVYGIVKQHNGEITVTSEVGEGATFTIYLPTMSAGAETAVNANLAQLRKGSGQTILLVEDNRTARQAIAEVLETLDYKVIQAVDGAAAIQYFATHADEVALVMTDMVMPKMGGSELYAQLKVISQDVKVVVITGYPLEESGQKLLSQGIVAWIQKPFSAERLAEVIHEVVG